MNYTVTFVKYYTYNVCTDDEDDAFKKAYEEYIREMYYPAADTWYDDVKVECDEEDED